MNEPKEKQSKAYIKANLKVGDWVRAESINRPMMVLSINRDNKQAQIFLGNGPQRVMKTYSKIICILED